MYLKLIDGFRRASQDGMELSNDDLQEVLAALTPRRKQQQPASTAHWAYKTKAEHMQTYRTDKNARLAKASQVGHWQHFSAHSRGCS